MSPEQPLVSRSTVREHARSSELIWEERVRAFDPYPERLRALADAANGQARVIRLAELAAMPWRPREGAEEISLADELEDAGGRPGPPALWAAFDRAVRGLGIAMAGDSTRAVYAAFEALRDSAAEVADELEAVAVDDPEVPGEQTG